MNKIRAWHFCSGWKLRDGQPLEVGKTYTHKGPLKMCASGLHASRKILDALRYAPGNTCCEVELWGDVVEDNDKLVARNRKVIAAIDATTILHEFACDCAVAALLLAEVEDQWCWNAIEAKWAWLRGDIDAQELAAAGNVARDTAWDAAWAAAWDAAGNAAGDAAWDAAYAAMDAAWDAARDATGDEQNTVLTNTIKEALKQAKE